MEARFYRAKTIIQFRDLSLGLDSRFQADYERTDLIVVYMANLINVIMAVLFAARISGLPRVEYALGIVVMTMGFALGYIAFVNKKNKRNKWDVYLLVPIFLFFVVDLILDYILSFDFRSTAIAGPYVLLYYVGLWGLIGYSFRFDRKWGFVTLATYFLNMILSILAHYV
jgi:predicted tellurium resistance membrane protein TerC